jgi:hypothetical protein
MPGMSANLSRRAGVAVNVLPLSWDERDRLIEAAEKARTFGNLPQEWKDYILAAEKKVTDAGYPLRWPQNDD